MERREQVSNLKGVSAREFESEGCVSHSPLNRDD